MYINEKYKHLFNEFYKLNQKFNLLKFYDDKHIYTYKNKEAMSASSVNAWSRKNFLILKQESRAMLNAAANKGTQTHAFIEELIVNNNADYSCFREVDYYAFGKSFKNWWDKVKSRFELVATELKLVADFSMAKVALCGTIDALLFDKETGKYLVIDWKSSQSRQKRNYYVLNYGIQLSIYKQLVLDNFNIDKDELESALVCVLKDDIKCLKM